MHQVILFTKCRKWTCREICVQVRESQGTFFRFLVGILIVMVDDLRDYILKDMIQNIIWSKFQINIKSRQNILSNSDIMNVNETHRVTPEYTNLNIKKTYYI